LIAFTALLPFFCFLVLFFLRTILFFVFFVAFFGFVFGANLFLALLEVFETFLLIAFTACFIAELASSHPYSGITFKLFTFYIAPHILGSSRTTFSNFLSNTIASGTEAARSFILSDNLVS